MFDGNGVIFFIPINLNINLKSNLISSKWFNGLKQHPGNISLPLVTYKNVKEDIICIVTHAFKEFYI